MIIHPRTEWVQGAYPFNPNNPVFPSWDRILWKVGHWPGGNVLPATYTAMRTLMQTWQRLSKTDPKEPKDIGYNWCLDPWGEWWEGRGFTYRNAANDGDKLKATLGNINHITFSVNVVSNLDGAANDAQRASLREMDGLVTKLRGSAIPWRPHSYSDTTGCPGDTNRIQIATGQWDYKETEDDVKIKVIRNKDDKVGGITCLTDGMSKTWLDDGTPGGASAQALARCGQQVPEDVDATTFASYGPILGVIPPNYDAYGRRK